MWVHGKADVAGFRKADIRRVGQQRSGMGGAGTGRGRLLGQLLTFVFLLSLPSLLPFLDGKGLWLWGYLINK